MMSWLFGTEDTCNCPDMYGFIGNNGDRAQDMENDYLNAATQRVYFQRLLDIALSVFKWEGLPEGIDSRQMEYWLIRDGFCGFIHDPDLRYGTNRDAAPEGYAVLPLMLYGDFDLYNIPKSRRAYAVNGTQLTLDQTDSVVIWNNQARLPMWETLRLFAYRLANAERTVDVNIMNQKTPKIFKCTDQQRLSIQNILMKIAGNQYAFLVDKKIDLSTVDMLDLNPSLVAPEVQVIKHQYWNEALTYLGIENTNTEKKERLISDEVFSNMGDVEAQRFTRLVPRLDACDKINEMFGLNVSVEFRSGQYIRADGQNSQQVISKGMSESGVDYE